MKKIFIITFLMFSFSCFAQDTKGTIKVKKVDTGQSDIIIPDTSNNIAYIVSTPLTIVEKMPTFPGGQKEMDVFFQKNLKYSKEEREASQGTVFVTFLVGVDGTVSDVKLLKGISGREGLNDEALRVVKIMPKWNPGMQNGRNVVVQYNLPVKFKL